MNIQILFAFVFVCALSDLRYGRIPNSLILCGLAGALLFRGADLCRSIYSLCTAGVPASSLLHFFTFLADGIAGGLVPWLLLGPLAARRMMGGADVKLLSVIGLQLGVMHCVKVMWYALLMAAVWCVVLVVRNRSLARRLRRLYRYAGVIAAGGSPGAYRPEGETDPGGEFCFAPFVLLSLLALLHGLPPGISG